MHTLMLLRINQYTKFKAPSLTKYKDRIGAKFNKTGHVTLTTHL